MLIILYFNWGFVVKYQTYTTYVYNNYCSYTRTFKKPLIKVPQCEH